MLMPSLRNWFSRTAETPIPEFVAAAEQEPLLADVPVVSLAGRNAVWTPERIRLVGMLWGAGFVFPGGEAETLRLAKPLGLSAALTLLLLGAGAGGPACAVASKLGVWVTGFEADADLAASAGAMIGRTKLGRRAQIETWDPGDPEFPRHYYHHGLALEPLHGRKPEPVLAAVAAALKPGGQFTMVELVADQPLDPADHDVAEWARLEHRRPETLPNESGVTRTLGRLGFDVRIAEDVSSRHMHQAMMGWRQLVRGMEAQRRPNREVAMLVNEAELWLSRLRLFRKKRLRLIRWYAIGRGTP